MIAPNQDPIDIIQMTDLFTTAARLGGALEHIPTDRITDGIEQSSLLCLGEGHGRRHYIMHYSGNGALAAVRLHDHKLGCPRQELPQGIHSAIGAPVIDQDDLGRLPELADHLHDALDERMHVFRFVENGNDHAQ